MIVAHTSLKRCLLRLLSVRTAKSVILKLAAAVKTKRARDLCPKQQCTYDERCQ